MNKFSVYYDCEGMQELLSFSPYNYNKDIKNISKDSLKNIVENIADELSNGVHRPPATSMIYWGKERIAGYAKVRIIDVENDVGKSKGYRCIVLVDIKNYRAFILHIYKHGSPKEDKLDRKAKNKLKELVNEYISSL